MQYLFPDFLIVIAFSAFIAMIARLRSRHPEWLPRFNFREEAALTGALVGMGC